MLEDRDYMRQSSGGSRWSATVILLVINVAVHIVYWLVLSRFVPLGYFALSLDGLKHGWVWQLLTFQFLHAGLFHLLFNSLALFFFGRAVEMVLGTSRFVQLYFASGVLGGLLQMALALLLPQYFDAPVVGASAGVAGLIAGFAMLNWDHRFTLFIYFFPVNMRGKTLLWISLALALIGLLSPGGYVAHAAHLGGLLMGIAFIRFRLGFTFRWNPAQARRERRIRAVTPKMSVWPISKSDDAVEVPEEEFISKEVDPILDKISAHGIQSLTDRERRILEAARSKMAKR